MTIQPVEDKACWACFKTDFKPVAKFGNSERVLSVCSVKCFLIFQKVMPTHQPIKGNLKDLKEIKK